VAPLIVQLQLFVSEIGVAIVHGLGVPVVREGNVITLAGGDNLFVAEACSGITSIITLTPLAVVLAYFTERSLWRRALLIAAVVPVAMAGNLLRVVLTIVASDAFGVERATESVLHESAGLLTFVLACLLLIAIGPLLRWLTPSARLGV
jgi:exosortase